MVGKMTIMNKFLFSIKRIQLYAMVVLACLTFIQSARADEVDEMNEIIWKAMVKHLERSTINKIQQESMQVLIENFVQENARAIVSDSIRNAILAYDIKTSVEEFNESASHVEKSLIIKKTAAQLVTTFAKVTPVTALLIQLCVMADQLQVQLMSQHFLTKNMSILIEANEANLRTFEMQKQITLAEYKKFIGILAKVTLIGRSINDINVSVSRCDANAGLESLLLCLSLEMTRTHLKLYFIDLISELVGFNGTYLQTKSFFEMAQMPLDKLRLQGEQKSLFLAQSSESIRKRYAKILDAQLSPKMILEAVKKSPEKVCIDNTVKYYQNLHDEIALVLAQGDKLNSIQKRNYQQRSDAIDDYNTLTCPSQSVRSQLLEAQLIVEYLK